MLAVDTNIIIRLLTEDDPEQFLRVAAMLSVNEIWIPVTVVLEAEWVLRRLYQLRPALVLAALRSLLGLPGVQLENAAAVSKAIAWFEQGMEFADALHLATAKDCIGMATFDRDFIKAAARLGAGNVAEP